MIEDWIECRLKEEAENCKEIVSGMKCKKHHLKAHVLYDYDNDVTRANLTKCCCPEFAKEVAHALREAEVIDEVDIEYCEYTKTV